MTSSGRFTLLLLVGAVFHDANAVKPLMRPNPQTTKRSEALPIHVASDGTTTQTHKDTLSGGPVIVAADGTLTETAPSSGSSLLQKVVDMAHSGEAIPADQVNVIKGLIDDHLIPSLTSSHTTAEGALQTSLDDIASCNTAKATDETAIDGSTKVSVQTARTAHSTCRSEDPSCTLAGGCGTLPHSCQQLDTFLGTLTNAPTLPTTPADITTWVEGMSENARCKGSVVTSYDDSCTVDKRAHSDQRALCSPKQATFESAFCTWNTLVTTMCSTLSTCYTSKNDAFDALVIETQALVAKFKVEFAALAKIKCFLEVWLLSTPITSTSYDHCESVTDTTSMDITPGTPANKAACATLVAPGTAGFIAAEYTPQAWSSIVEATNACAGTSSSSLIEVLGGLPAEHEEARRGDLGKMKLVNLMMEAQTHLNDSDFHNVLDALTGLQDDQVKPKLIEMILAKETTKA